MNPIIAVCLFNAILLIFLSFVINKHPDWLAGYTPDTPKESIKYAKKVFLITGLVYFPLSLVSFLTSSSFILTTILLLPILIALILVVRKLNNH